MRAEKNAKRMISIGIVILCIPIALLFLGAPSSSQELKGIFIFFFMVSFVLSPIIFFIAGMYSGKNEFQGKPIGGSEFGTKIFCVTRCFGNNLHEIADVTFPLPEEPGKENPRYFFYHKGENFFTGERIYYSLGDEKVVSLPTPRNAVVAE